MARLLLDTDAVIDYLKGYAETVALLDRLDDEGETLCICDVVVTEVFAGLLPRDYEQGVSFLETCEFLSTTMESARQAGEWRFQYARSGMTVATTDAIVAAVAHHHLARVVTANMRHYPMPEVSTLALPRSRRRR
jgi:predicted nucleic acid-binding protein